MTRTLIDILRRGNQELFHSSMIAWLLNPEAEHGLGRRFLERFADKLAVKGHPKLKEAVEASPSGSVKTEVRSRKSRYDIEICFGDAQVVIENKTKSVGEKPQLDRYGESGAETVALGLCDVSFTFPESEHQKYPLILYQDVLDILCELEVKEPEANKFAILIQDYREFLKRELSLLKLIVDRYKRGNSDARGQILETIGASLHVENDLRFFNLFILENFKRECLQNGERWQGACWHANKNQSSGVWLANKDCKLPTRYSFAAPLKFLCQERDAKLWFHIELKKNLFSPEPQDGKVGEFQIRCSTESSNRQFMDEFKEAHSLEKGESYRPGKPQETDKSFYIVRRDLSEADFEFDRLERRLVCFHEEFGSFHS